METLTRDVAVSTELEPTIANSAVGYVLLFLRDEVPESRIAEFIDKNKLAHEAVQAAAAAWDGGVTAAIEGLTSFMGHGRADVNNLAGNLENLGLTAEQINRLVQQIMARAEALVGRDGAERIREILPALAERSGQARGPSAQVQPEAKVGSSASGATSPQPEPPPAPRA